MTNFRALAVMDDAPPPLDPLTNVVISPANIAAEARRQRAQTLGFRQRRKIQGAVKKLDRQLKRVGYAPLMEESRDLRLRMETLHQDYLALRGELAANPEDLEAKQNLKSLHKELVTLKARWEQLKQHIQPLRPIWEDYQSLQMALEDDSIARARLRAERKLMEAMVKEAKIYERLIIDKWTALGFAYKRTEGSKYKVDRVKFSEVAITVDAIYFKIAASYKTAFGNWQTQVPEGVYVGSQLLDEKTLVELGIACQRQVTGAVNTNGAFVIVHRLDSIDGLMNYVSWVDVMERYPEKYHERFPICVGVGMARKVQWCNLSDYPHWLIGGFTNSGKSNMVNVGISTLITKHSPMDIRLILIDLKGGLEFSYYKGIPHLHGDTVESIEGIANALAELEAIMHDRFRRFKGVAKKIEEYHLKRSDYMPRILVVFDEVASLMDHGDLTKQILASLRELTRMGRAVGIHVWLCTQRPDVKVIDGQIKNNLSVRLSGRMASSSDSVTILGNSTAKELAPIQGRMVLQLGPDPIFIQTPHITDEMLTESISRAKLFELPPPLDVPDYKRVTHQHWTWERVVELSIKHLGGNISARPVWEAADDLSQAQARELVEIIWGMDSIPFGGKTYRVQALKGKQKRLVEVADSAIP